MEAFSSYTLYYLYEYQQCPASSSRPDNLGTDSDVDDGHRDRHSPAEIFFDADRHHTRDRAEIVSDPGRRDDANDVAASRTPPLT